MHAHECPTVSLLARRLANAGHLGLPGLQPLFLQSRGFRSCPDFLSLCSILETQALTWGVNLSEPHSFRCLGHPQLLSPEDQCLVTTVLCIFSVLPASGRSRNWAPISLPWLDASCLTFLSQADIYSEILSLASASNYKAPSPLAPV